MMMIFKQFSVTHTLFHFDVLLYNSMNLLSVWLQLSFGKIDVKFLLIFGKKYSIATDGLKIPFRILVLFWYTLIFPQ